MTKSVHVVLVRDFEHAHGHGHEKDLHLIGEWVKKVTMDGLQIIIVLMSIAILLVNIAIKINIPYPLALILGGAALGFTPGLQEIHFDPNLVLVIVLPPIIYYSAYSLPYKEFKKNLNSVLWLAFVLVCITTLVLGVIFKALFPELPWALAFTFGAIISPPDAVSATSVLKKFNISPRLLSLLEGESLMNDATGLVLYRLAVAALLSGFFDYTSASIEFVKVVAGGVGVGLIMGYAAHLLSSRFFDATLAVVFSIVIPYITYIIADALHVSGVLAVVVCGLIGANFLVSHFSSLTRVIGWATWDIFIILLNCFVFILIGFQLQDIIHRLSFNQFILYVCYGCLLTFAALAVRILCVYLRIGFLYFKKEKMEKEQMLKEGILLSISGMRGIVSMALALALPFYLPDGTPLDGRDTVIFLSFIIILLTLLIPGLLLESLIKFLNIQPVSNSQDSQYVRDELIKTASEELQIVYKKNIIDENQYHFLNTYFQTRHQVAEIALKHKKAGHLLESIRLAVLRKKRDRLLKMWKNSEIDDQQFHNFERELDLEESYLARAEI